MSQGSSLLTSRGARQPPIRKIIPWLFFFLLVGPICISWIYAHYGHTLIQSVFEGKSLPVLNAIIQKPPAYPLQIYLDTGDAMFLALLVLGMTALASMMLARYEWQMRGQAGWIFAGAIMFVIVSMAYLRPQYAENEYTSLIGPMRIANPSFLAHDWIWQTGHYGYAVFDRVVGPFLRLLEPLTVALLGRGIVWIGSILSLIVLAGTLGLRWWVLAAGFALWFYSGQSLAAGEFVFGGFEAKSIAYIFLFLGLRCVLKNQLIIGGILAGLSVCFHVLVGGWGILGLSAAVLAAPAPMRWACKTAAELEVSLPAAPAPMRWACKTAPKLEVSVQADWRALNAKKIALFFLSALLVSIPCFIPALFGRSALGMRPEDLAIDVLFRGPHHMDPRHFLSLWTAVKILLFYGVVVYVWWRAFLREHAVRVIAFLTVLMGAFLAGLMAREMNAYAFLYLYPFRLGPLFLLLFFFLGVLHFVGSRMSLKPAPGRRVVLVMGFVLALNFLGSRMPERVFKDLAYFIADWRNFLVKSHQDAFVEVTEWIKRNTPEGSVFIAPPWEYGFWIRAERAHVVSYKYVPNDIRIREWMARLVDLNAGIPFKRRGSLRDLKEHYPGLSLKHLKRYSKKYGAAYYLTTAPRLDLESELLYANRSYFLYNLRNSETSP